MCVPVVNGVGRANRDSHEEHLCRVLEQLHRIGAADLLVDIGANIGQTLIKYMFVAGERGRYIGFEPNVKAVAYMEEMIQCNSLPKAQVVPVALGSEVKLASLQMSSPVSVDPGASMNEKFRDASFYGTKKIVPVFEGDAVLKALGVEERYFTVKIDTEGYEPDVVRGLQQTLQALRPYVIMEILPPAHFSEAVNNFRIQQAAELKDTMAGLGYTFARIGADGELYVSEAKDRTLTHDYLFIPTERVTALRVWEVPPRTSG